MTEPRARPVFVDTSALYAILDGDDANHDTAASTWDALLDDTTLALRSSSYVLVEITALVQRRLGVEAVRSLDADVLPVLDLRWVDDALHRSAMSALLAQGHRGVSLVDWVSFIVMREEGLTTAFAYDDDFTSQGFRLTG